MLSTIYPSGPSGFLVFLFVSCGLGAVTAWMAGRAIAQTWRPFWHIPAYAALLVLVVRFLHFALFEETLLAIPNILVDYAVLFLAAVLGHRTTRTGQMASQYDWLFDRANALWWIRRRDG